MNNKQLLELTPEERLLYWIRERESIRVKKERGDPPPWTTDPILSTYRFCNVRRMDDKVSRWLMENWYEPYRDHPNMLYAVALARFLNLPSSLDLVTRFVFQDGYGPAWGSIKRTLRAGKNAGSIFNGAYMVRGNDGEDKVASVVDYYVGALVKMNEAAIADKAPLVQTSSMQRTCENLSAVYGFGSFMAGQVVADLRWAVTGAWADKETWAPQGPGSTRGLNRLHGRPVKSPMRPDHFLQDLLGVVELGLSKLPSSITSRLEANDYQNVLCETDKHSRALFGEGRPKQVYRCRS